MFGSNVSSEFLCFVGKVFDEKTGKVITRVNGWQYFRWIIIIIIIMVIFKCYFSGHKKIFKKKEKSNKQTELVEAANSIK